MGTLPPIISLHLKNKASSVPSTVTLSESPREGLSSETYAGRSGNLLYMGDKNLLPDGSEEREIMGQNASFTRHDPSTTANEDAYENNPIFEDSITTVAPPVPLYNKNTVNTAAGFMAEEAATSSGTWYVLAAAAGAAGLAMVALSRKREAVVIVDV